MAAESFQFDREMRVSYLVVDGKEVIRDVVVDGRSIMRAGVFIPGGGGVRDARLFGPEIRCGI